MNNFSQPQTNEGSVVITCSLIGILILLTLLGNVLIITAFCLFKELRTITNYFLVSLSMADLLTAFLSMPIYMAVTITNGKFFPGGAIFLGIWRSMDIICGTASIWNLCLVSLDRFLAVSSPLKRMVILTPGKSKTAILLVWTLSTGISGLIHLNWTYRGVLITVISFFLPLVVIIFSYIKIYQVTTRSCALRRSGGKQLKRDIYSAKQMVLVISVFIVCWFGFFLLTFLFSTTSSSISISPVVLNILKALTYLNSCINPVLISLASKRFKKAVVYILYCCGSSSSDNRAGYTPVKGSSFLASSFSRKQSNFQLSLPMGNIPCSKPAGVRIERETAV